MLSMIAGVLGVLMFVWGFLRWFNTGDDQNQHKYSGYAFMTPSTAVIGFSLAAGLIAVLGATERRRGRGVPTAVPTALAATSLLLAIAILLAVVIKAFFVQAFYIPSESMEPGLVKNDRILVEKTSYWFGGTPQRGDVGVFKDQIGRASGREKV